MKDFTVTLNEIDADNIYSALSFVASKGLKYLARPEATREDATVAAEMFDTMAKLVTGAGAVFEPGKVAQRVHVAGLSAQVARAYATYLRPETSAETAKRAAGMEAFLSGVPELSPRPAAG